MKMVCRHLVLALATVMMMIAAEAEGCPLFCPANYSPVCGSDGRTYGNLCALEMARCDTPSLYKVRDGECGTRSSQEKCDGLCQLDYSPVCGSDGVTYGNECQFQQAQCMNPNIIKKWNGSCDGKDLF